MVCEKNASFHFKSFTGYKWSPRAAASPHIFQALLAFL